MDLGVHRLRKQLASREKELPVGGDEDRRAAGRRLGRGYLERVESTKRVPLSVIEQKLDGPLNDLSSERDEPEAVLKIFVKAVQHTRTSSLRRLPFAEPAGDDGV